MIKNFKDTVVLLITAGILILLAVIIVGDYWVALEENRPADESVITLMKMSVTGLIGVVGGYIGGGSFKPLTAKSYEDKVKLEKEKILLKNRKEVDINKDGSGYTIKEGPNKGKTLAHIRIPTREM